MAFRMLFVLFLIMPVTWAKPTDTHINGNV